MHPEGWYPDPEQPARSRYWDGRAWTPHTVDHQAPQLIQGTSTPQVARRRGRSRGLRVLLIGSSAVALVLVVLLVSNLVTGGGVTLRPGGDPVLRSCPTADAEDPTLSIDDRVHNAGVSYPLLEGRWWEPEVVPEFPFGQGVTEQFAETETKFLGSWGASVIIGELASGDGFFTPRDGAERIVSCVTGIFYRDALIDRIDAQNKEAEVDGRDAWLIQTHLTFDLSDINARGERLTVIIIDLPNSRTGIFLNSVPDNAPELLGDADAAEDGLHID